MEKEKPFPEVSRTTISYTFREGGSILISSHMLPPPQLSSPELPNVPLSILRSPP